MPQNVAAVPRKPARPATIAEPTGAYSPERRDVASDLEVLLAFEDAFRHSPSPGVIVRNGRIIRINQAAERVFGHKLSPETLDAILLATAPHPAPEERLVSSRSGDFTAVRVPSRRTDSLQAFFFEPAPPQQPYASDLSRRECGVLLLVIKGMTNAEIAAALEVSIETVRKHVSHLLAKTHQTSRTGLAVRAVSDAFGGHRRWQAAIDAVTRSGY